jgi:hypothetical protein
MMRNFKLATFRCDVTPPLGHPLCGGWIEPVRGFDDPLWAHGIILLGQGDPIVMAVLDWCGLRNDGNLLFRKALAEATHTSLERVTVHSVHPHNAPFADVEAEKMLRAIKGPASLDLDYFVKCVKRLAESAASAMKNLVPFDQVGFGKAKIEQVASNRRILGDNGKIKFTRTSATKDPVARAAPEGLIDPFLRSLSFWDGSKCQAILHYYATHPMSYYGDGRVSADFCGLAREKLNQENPGIHHIYFTGCSGNVTAGKYNDGSKDNRVILRDRIYNAMKEAIRKTNRFPVTGMDWRSEPVLLKPRSEASFTQVESDKLMRDEKANIAKRNNAAYQLAWLKRIDRPIDVGCVDFDGKLMVLHLPGEPFIEYQLAAQKFRSDIPVLVAGYGDDGPGYLLTEKAYLEGGYEPTVALANSETESILTKAMQKLLNAQVTKKDAP